MTLGFIGDLLGLNAGDPAINAANRNIGDLKRFKTEGMGYIDTGYNDARTALDKNVDLTSLGPNASGIYGDALGLNGAEGNARAQGAFTAGPGYDFQMDQGLQALERRAAAQGRLQSGETGLDTLRFSQGLASQGWQQWLDNLNRGIDRSVGAQGDIATLATGTAGQKVGFGGDILSGIMDARNGRAEGEGANKAGMSSLFGNILGAFTGYGGF